jgi:hypothetical protein
LASNVGNPEAIRSYPAFEEINGDVLEADFWLLSPHSH